MYVILLPLLLTLMLLALVAGLRQLTIHAACICSHTMQEHAEIWSQIQGRQPHAGYCKTCSCRVYIAR